MMAIVILNANEEDRKHFIVALEICLIIIPIFTWSVNVYYVFSFIVFKRSLRE